MLPGRGRALRRAQSCRSLAKHRRFAVECELGALRGVAAHVSVAHPLEIGPWQHAHARPCVELGLNVCRDEFCRDKRRGAKQTAGVAADSPHSRCYDVLPVGGVFEARPADRGAAVRHKIGVGRGAHVIRAVATPASVERILIVGVAGIVCVWRRLHARSGDAIGPRGVCRTLSEHTVGVGMAVGKAIGGKVTLLMRVSLAVYMAGVLLFVSRWFCCTVADATHPLSLSTARHTLKAPRRSTHGVHTCCCPSENLPAAHSTHCSLPRKTDECVPAGHAWHPNPAWPGRQGQHP